MSSAAGENFEGVFPVFALIDPSETLGISPFELFYNMEFLKVFCINRTSSRFPAVPGILILCQDVYWKSYQNLQKKVPSQLFVPTRNSGPTVSEKSLRVVPSDTSNILGAGRDGQSRGRIDRVPPAFPTVPKRFPENQIPQAPFSISYSPPHLN